MNASLRARLCRAVALLLCISAPAWGAFDPVNDDTDIFMTNPSITSERPNVLIVLDTSANWQSYFTNEKSALISVVSGLSDQYNVGLAMNAGGSIEGSFVRFAIRQMTTTNKTALTSLVNTLTNAPSTSYTGDKTNNAVPGLSLVEAYRYFKGLASYSAGTATAGHDPRTDYAGNTTNTFITSLAGNAFSSTPSVSTTYTSPIADGCQKNFIIYISNGKGSNQTGEKTSAKNELSAAKGSTATAISPLTPSGNETESWFDEWAKWLANTGFSVTVNSTTRTVTAQTYVIEVNPGTQSADQQWTATLKSGASNGKGKYYAATGDDPGASLVSALNAIFSEIQAVNSVFASTTLPVSVNVRGTNLNQVYIGMFRPDAVKQPRWFGNLKLYKLGLASDNTTLQLQDAASVAIESATTGFVTGTARSYWTHDSTFWSYRDSSQNGSGGSSDSPDGDLVEKGAVAQRLRDAYESSQSTRKVYTCTTGSYANCNPCTLSGTGSSRTCSSGSSLASTPFSTANTDIDNTALALSTKDVTPLTAKVTKAVTSIKDRRDVTLSNTTGTSHAISTVSNGATLKTLSALSAFDSAKTMSISSLTALGSTTSAYGVSARSNSGSSVTLSFAKPSGSTSNPCSGLDTVVVSGNDTTVNGTWTISGTSGTSSPARWSVTFTVSSSSPSPSNAGTLTCGAKSTTATATVSSLPSGLTTNSRVNVSGASPSEFNGNFSVTGVSGNTFTYTIGSNQGAATTPGTLKVYNTVDGSGNYSAGSATVRATATTSTAHGFVANNSVVIADVTSTSYNGTVTVKTANSATNTFTYDIAGFTGSLADATAFGSVYSASAASTTVTVTTSSAHGLANPAGVNKIDIAGVGSCYNMSAVGYTWISTTSFSYVTTSACAPLASNPTSATVTGSGYGATVTATLANHGFTAGVSSIVIADGTQACHNGTFTVIAPVDTNTFTYTNDTTACGGGSAVGPSGQYTARLAANPLAYVASAGHGFSTGDSITIAGTSTAVVGTDYNGTFSITSIDTDNFSYALASAKGTNTGTSVTASKNTTTARATSTNHGFADQSSVQISGATDGTFNGTFTITKVDDNTFTYTIGSAKGDAAGTIKATAAATGNSERDNIINWVRGQDNNEDENSNSSRTDCRASVHGDVLHSRPAVINYSRYWKDAASASVTHGENDVYIYYGANDSVFRAVKGGTTTDYGDSTTLNPGDEAWGFVPKESFGDLKRLRNNSPTISSTYKKPYFMDGPIGVYTVSTDGKKIDYTTSTDKAYLYVGARRGGRYYYSLDVTNPLVPYFRWKLDTSTTGFSELGQSWSQPTVVTDSDYTKDGTNGTTRPVLIFGGGYDSDVEDIENCRITSVTNASYNAATSSYSAGTVTYYSGAITYTSTGCTTSGGTAISSASSPLTTVSRSKGRAIYIVDAVTGELIWWAGHKGSGATLEVDGLDYAVPSDITVVRNESGGHTNRAYVGDTGGNLWRIDFRGTDTAAWTVTKIASISTMSTAAGRRKFLYAPDVVGMTGYDAILMGSGDREHPFDVTVTNRMYMFKDKGTDSGPVTGVDNTASSTAPTINESRSAGTAGSLFDATTNCLQECTGSDLTAAITALTNSDGWYVTLGTGEKVVGNAIALNGSLFFNTNTPESQDSNSTTCESSLGIARQYEISVGNATATRDLDSSGTKTRSDRYTVHTGGGYLPSPVHAVVEIGGKVYEGVISGTTVQTPSTTPLGTRARRFWYKELD